MGNAGNQVPNNVQTYFSPELAIEFVKVKTHYGIATNADVVRFLVKKEAREIASQKKAQPEVA